MTVNIIEYLRHHYHTHSNQSSGDVEIATVLLNNSAHTHDNRQSRLDVEK